MTRAAARDILRLAWPVTVAQIATMANGVIDTVMAGHYSARALAVVGLGSAIYMTIFVALMGILIALSPTIAQHHGAGRADAITHDVRQGLWLSALIILVSEPLLAFPEPLIALSGMQPEVAAEVRSYLRVLMWAMPAMMLFRVFNSWGTAISQPRAVMVIQIAGLVLKVPLNWMLMYGHFGLPAMGGIGCAWALVIESWLMLAAALAWIHWHPVFRRYRVFAKVEAPDWRAIGRLVALGVPIGVSFLIDVTSYTFMALFIARLGEEWSAGHQIAANLGALAYMVPLGLSSAAAVLVGQAIGAGDPVRARAAGFTGMVIGFCAALLVASAIALGGTGIAGLYTSDAKVAAVAAPLIVLVACFHIFDASNAMASNAVRGYKKAWVPMLTFALSLWGVGLGGGYLLAFHNPLGANLGAAGFWTGAIGGMALAAGIGVVYFERVSRQAITGRSTQQPPRGA
ncbi:MAG: MATE family efflux transporter [Burkholderiales bacterium]